jgi:uncharacterized protein DUF4838
MDVVGRRSHPANLVTPQLALGLLLGTLVAAPVAAQDAVVLTAESDVRIIELGEFGNARSRLSELLERYLLRALGKTALAGKGKRVTFLIEPTAPEWTGIPQGAVKDMTDLDAFEITVRQGVVRISGATVLATGFGVMHFLEKHLGVMWLFPGELGLHVPPQREVRIPTGRERVTPAVASRLCTGFVYRDKSIPAKRFVYSGLLHRQSIFFYGHDYFKSARVHHLASPSHHMIHIFPLSTREDHPELLPIKDGKRWIPPDKDTPKGRVGYWQAWHPCYTKPKTVEIAARKAAQAFDQGHTYCFSLGINDGRRIRCECADCQRVGWPDSYYRFVARVADQVRSYYPPRLVGVIAYGDVTQPPKDLKLPENVLVMCVSGGPNRLTEWAPHASQLGMYQWAHGLGYWIPNLPLAGMAANARYWRERNVKCFRTEVHPLWAFDGPKVYLYLRLLWNPDMDLDAGLRRYCDAAYGRGGEAVYRFFQHWAAKRRDVAADAVTPMHGGVWPFGHWRNAVNQFVTCSAKDFDVSTQCLRDAAKAVRAEPARKRLAMLDTFVDDSRTLFRMQRFADRMTDADHAGNLAVDRREGQRLIAHRRKLLTRMRAHPEWFLGTKAGVDKDLQPSWEQRAQMVRATQVRNAILTRKLGSKADAQPVRTHTRPKHPWFPEHLWVRLDSDRQGETVRFPTTRTDQRITDHPNLKGRRKPHWLAAFVVNTPVSDTDVYVLELTVRASKGRLGGVVQFASGGATRVGAHIAHVFDRDETLRKRIAFPAMPVRVRPGHNPPKPGAKGMITLYLRWQPHDDQAPLQGVCSVKRVAL